MPISGIPFLNVTNTSKEIQIVDATQPRLSLYVGTNVAGGLSATSTGSLVFETSSGIERARILSTGQFGIGTTTPGAKLEVFNSGGTVFNVLGSLGQLFSVTDNLSGEIFAVADISGVPIMSINSNGSIKFGSYSGTNQTGTPTYMLGTTATGGVVKVLGADIPGVPGGSGTLNTLPLWTPDGDTLGNSRFTQSSTINLITGPSNLQADDSLRVQNLGGSIALRILGDGIVNIPSNYLHVSNSQGIYSDGVIRARAGISDDQGTLGLGGNNTTNNLTLTSNTLATFAGSIAGTSATFDSLSAYPTLTLARSTQHAGASFTFGVSNFSGAGADLLIDSVGNSTGFGFRTRDSSGNQQTALVIGPGGDVGIGVAVPLQPLHVIGAGLFTGLVSGITPVAAANFVTKAYVDGSGGGTGPFLPLAGGTMAGNIIMGDNDITGIDQLTFSSGTYLQDISSNYVNLRYASATAGGLLVSNGNGTQGYVYASGAVTSEFGLLTGAGQWAVRTVENGLVELRHNNAVKLQTTNTGVSITGTCQPDALTMLDNEYIRLGNSGDLEIYHDGSNSFIKDAGTGALFVETDVYRLVTPSAAQSMISANSGGSVTLYNAGSQKFITTATGVTITGTATATTFSGDLNGTINTATTAVTQVNAVDNETVATTAYVNNKIQLIPAGLIFQGTWDARTAAEGGAVGNKGNPALTSGVGTTGNFYIVSNSGSVNLDGITDWKVGDWAVFIEQGASDQWEKIDNSSVLDGFGTGGSVAGWSGSGTSNTLTNAPITFSGNNSTFAGGVTAAGTFSSTTTGRAFSTETATNVLFSNIGGVFDVLFGDGAARYYSLHTPTGAATGSIRNYSTSTDIITWTSGGNTTFAGDVIVKTALLSNQENTDVDTGTETIAEVAVATYTAAFFDFVVKKTTNVRSGTVYACHDGTNVQFTETSTQDLGDTSDVVLSVDISGGQMRLLATVASNDWSIKSLIRAI